MKKKLLAGLLMVATIATVFVGCGNNEKKEENVDKKEKAAIKVATSPTFAPCIYRDENGNLAGFEYEVFEEIGKRTGREIEWVPMEGMDSLFGSLDAGKVDTISYQISVNEERKANYTFSDVYGYNEIFLCVREDFKYDTLEDLHGKKVNVPPVHSLYTILEKYNENLPDDQKIQLVASEGGTMYELLEQGKFDAFPITALAFNATMEKKDYKVRIDGEPQVVEENAYPFSKNADPEMIEDVNNAIHSMQEDGTLAELSMKHYKLDVTKPSK